MRAIVIRQYGGPEQLQLVERPMPQARQGEILIRVRAFGINRAETYMRKGVWGDVAEISGIECVGTVASDPSGLRTTGCKVAALMGGMGRTIDGSYAEYTCVPATNVVTLDSDLPWEELAAIPESYATAWSCLHANLAIEPGQRLLIRGATSALGQAALNIAARRGVHVLATTRNRDKFDLLRALGAADVMLHERDLGPALRGNYPRGVDAVLDLIGNSTLLDSLTAVHRHGRVCLAGFLGGGEPIPDFNPLAQMPSGVQLSFFASFMLGTPEFPLDEIPLQTIVEHVAASRYRAKPVRVFSFEDIADAHRLMESNQADGKIVVRL